MEPALRPVLVPKTGGDEFDRLKTLLFRPEAKRLEEIESAVSGLDARVGTPDRLELATTQVLVNALRRAEVAQHKELSQAIAPVVVAAIRSEIKNSKDMMVEALYPITGRLVAAGIRVAIAELAASINARMDRLLSARSIGLRIQAWRTGRPLAELAMAQPLPGRLVRLLQLERGSGVLLGQWQADHGEDERADLIGGMIAALTDFARTALGPSGGELRTLDLGGRLIYLRNSARMIVAAEYEGPLLPVQQGALDSGFLDLLEQHERDGGAPEAGLQHLAATLSAQPVAQPRPGWRPSPLLVAGLLLLALLAWWGFFALQRWRLEARVAQAVQSVAAARPELSAYPVVAQAQHGASVISLRGLVPDVADRATLEAAVAQAGAPYALASSIAIVGTAREAADLRAQLVATNAELAAARAALAQGIEARRVEAQGQAQALAALGSELGGAREEIARDSKAESGAIRAQLAGEQARLEATRAALAREIAEGRSGQEGLARLLADQAGELEAARARLAGQTQAEASALRGQIAEGQARLGAQIEAQRAALALELKAARQGQQEQIAAVEVRMAAMRGELSSEAKSATGDLRAQGEASLAALALGQKAAKETQARQMAELSGQSDARTGDLRSQIAALQAAIQAAKDSGQQQMASVEARIATTRDDLSAQAQAATGELRARMEASHAALALELKAAKDAGARELAATGEQMAAMQMQLQTGFATLVSGLADTSGALQARIEARDAAIRGEIAKADARAAAGLERAGEAMARLDAPAARLAEALRGFAVFFEENDTIVDEPAVRARLAQIALLAGPAGGIRIHGHSDAKGTPARNQAVSRQRAEAVARLLADLGVDRARMVIVSHGNSQPLADAADGNGRRNRRVTLEPLYADELPP